MLFSQTLERLIRGEDLTGEEAFACAGEILEGRLSPVQTAACLTALRAKGETIEEITGFVRAMRSSMTKVSSAEKIIVDTCGTGGDSKGTFNVSTASAFVVAGAGFFVAKHGNRSISSACGSADVLEALGVKVNLPKEKAEACLKDAGIVFLFAPAYHPAMKNVAPVRRELGVRTIFNILGPLANPAGANAQVIGVPRKELVATLAKVLQSLNLKGGCVIVVHEDGHDELILQGKDTALLIQAGKIKKIRLGPAQFGLKKANLSGLKGGDAQANAKILLDFLSGRRKDIEDVVLANAALAMFCAQTAGGNGADLKKSLGMARKSLESGAALQKLKKLKEMSQ